MYLQHIQKTINELDRFLAINVDHCTYIEIRSDLDILLKQVKKLQKETCINTIKECLESLKKNNIE